MKLEKGVGEPHVRAHLLRLNPLHAEGLARPHIPVVVDKVSILHHGITSNIWIKFAEICLNF